MVYFAGFLPIKFINLEGVYFYLSCTLSLTLFFWNNSTMFLISYFMLYKSDELHYQCLQYGYWQRITFSKNEMNFIATIKPYQAGRKYKKNSLVSCAGTYYKGIEESNSYNPNETLP